MNKICKLKFDRKLQQLIAASKLATGAGKKQTTSGALSGALHTSLQAIKLLSSKLTSLARSLSLADLPTGGQTAGSVGQSTAPSLPLAAQLSPAMPQTCPLMGKSLVM